MIRPLALILAISGPAFAEDLAPSVSREPIQRPAADQSGEEPDLATGESGGSGPVPATPPLSSLKTGGTRDLLTLTDAAYETCLASLKDMGVTFTEIEPIVPADDVDCGILRPLKVSEILPGVALIPEATLRCPTVEALSIWTKAFVVPATDRLGNRGNLTAIETASGYTCRRRNNQPDGKLSEHAFGNAVDVLAFRFAEGGPLVIEPREAQGTMEEAFQDAVRASACLDFSTVLGPGSNASHDDHLHLDIIERNSGYRLCEQGGSVPE